MYAICASGNRSRTAADWMNSRGIDAHSVADGTSAWVLGGRPVTTGPVEHAA
ncbi:rhodanese-like domain-containing protein [Streptomyces sp. NPDC005784]|uniref:rhodanese-like domain-containing protein n=1 Tax=Streptomyces sp. NPDC005784 TaxID=3364731 RepID=UPI0036AA625D